MSLLDTPPSYKDTMRRSKTVSHKPTSSTTTTSLRSSSSTRRPKQKRYVADTIDRLDTTGIGGAYHHGGPYDAALPSFNLNRKFSPLAATKDSNRAAWDATPREAQLDALLQGRPLDGVGTVPPGERAMNGQVMQYEEGPDLMRDMEPGGGAYKRWPGIQYHPDDLKGKGEPGFTIDRERKARKAAANSGGGGLGRSQSVRERERGGVYEMVPQPSRRRHEDGKQSDANPVLVRQRSSSASAVGVASGSGGARQSASQLKEGLKRRIGSLRRK